ncbi:MAG: pitrilysin family protein [Armatimonadota bacterium]
MYKKTVLDNGLKILTEYIPGFRSVSLGIWINIGSKYEPKDKNGYSHFIEHLMFKGTKRYSARDIAKIMDTLGGMLNAFTEKEQTCYYAKVSDQHLTEAVDLLSELLLNSVYDPHEIEREKDVVLDELRLSQDSPDEYVFELFYRNLWPHHALGRSTLGTEGIIKNIKRKNVIEFIDKYYTPSNIIVAAAGQLEHDKLVEQINKIFGKLKKGRKHKEEKFIRTSKQRTVNYKEGEQVYICMGGEGTSQKNDDKYKLIVLDSILGGSMSSRLFQEVREKRGLVYNISTFQHSFYNAGVFGIYAGTHVRNLQKLQDITYNIIDKIKKKGPGKEEIHRAKEHIKGNLILNYENTVSRMLRLAKSEFYNGKLLDFDTILKKVDNVNLEDVIYIANKYLKEDRFAVAVLGPVK